MNLTFKIKDAYLRAQERYAFFGVDTEKAMDELKRISISLHCWQADDVGGFETADAELSGGGIQATGNYPGKARNINELRSDLETVYKLIPGNHRLNLHASYGDFGGKFVDRNEIDTGHFESWADWANEQKLKLDFNSTCYSHPKSDDGFTLSSIDYEIREFWKEHVRRAREIAAYLGEKTGSPCIHNIWVPDGIKDLTVNRLKHREILRESLDDIFRKEYPDELMKDSIESKLFGIGSEAYVVGSHEFYMAYGLTRNKMICIDMGHFHPTEQVGDKVSSLFSFVDELMFHLSRGIRWDSDHVVILNDDLEMVTHEIVRAGALHRSHIGLDFFDASINRVGAYVTGTRAAQVSFLKAMLEPVQKIREYEESGKGFEKLSLFEEMKLMPFGDVWNYFCLQNDVPTGTEIFPVIQEYENNVLAMRQ
ncbi:MAG: L-rhamnose isomerase [Bacteroidales bacterium]|nr:L-rhamnose isomerase [Bacteroidales bacterium]